MIRSRQPARGYPKETVRWLVGILLASLCAEAAAQTPVPEEKKEAPPGIQDNSFLMEEAYNQEEGVVQHINSFQRMRGGGWLASFTQEYPVPRQTHQLSYTIPYLRVADAAVHSGLGDIALNYRYQLAGSGDAKFSCAPRLSVLLPSGDYKRELGSGGVGVQVNVAMSTVLSEKFVTHSNFGGTYFPSAKDAQGEKAAARGANAGQSLIWLIRNDLNAMLEAVWSYSQAVTAPGQTRGTHTFFVSPGIRWAFNSPTGLQIVPGIAVPLGVGPSRGDLAVLVYLSFEHPMWYPAR
ncbi:MAG TPA: transporter [Thermoanaerobaculia bacterium]|nr:transporter [Thermoanaerobaculia bacterium]